MTMEQEKVIWSLLLPAPSMVTALYRVEPSTICFTKHIFGSTWAVTNCFVLLCLPHTPLYKPLWQNNLLKLTAWYTPVLVLGCLCQTTSCLIQVLQTYWLLLPLCWYGIVIWHRHWIHLCNLSLKGNQSSEKEVADFWIGLAHLSG